ncbi:MAG: Gfo/Idh/MocA family oxidoreductase, partial [Planctomycetaceae bacterium]|nr:Gfo/Idh/MocA family oxidoreductase [Planctomycetaceae bacterium]
MNNKNRRQFLATSGVLATTPYFFTNVDLFAQENKSKNDKLNVGNIGVGGRGTAIARQSLKLGNPIACCDVDKNRAAAFSKNSGNNCAIYHDYRELLDRDDIDVVTIGTPDHWHVKIAIEALRAGKDVYCEKPLTLTIEEGILVGKVVKETGKVFQVGTQQRSEYGGHFLNAVAICQLGW